MTVISLNGVFIPLKQDSTMGVVKWSPFQPSHGIATVKGVHLCCLRPVDFTQAPPSGFTFQSFHDFPSEPVPSNKVYVKVEDEMS